MYLQKPRANVRVAGLKDLDPVLHNHAVRPIACHPPGDRLEGGLQVAAAIADHGAANDSFLVNGSNIRTFIPTPPSEGRLL